MIFPGKTISLFTLAILLCFFMMSVSSAQEEDTTKGRLGYPLGTRLIIKGIRHAALKKKGFYPTDRGSCILVDTINGIKLYKPIDISIESVRKIGDFHTNDFRYTYLGFESGRWIGNDSLSQAVPQFYRYFIVDSVLYPTALDNKKIDSTGHK
jgi:hypothetical protein